MMESHHFNTYSSAKYSNEKRTLYLALNKKGISRKVQTKAKASLGKMETYTNVLTKPVSPERVEALAIKVAKTRALLGKFFPGSSEDGSHHLLRHHRYQFCPNVPMTKLDDKNKFRCRKREKRKKKRKCKDDEDDEEECQVVKKKVGNKCEEDEDEEECQKRLHSVRQKRKSRNGGEVDNLSKSESYKSGVDDKEKKRKRRLKLEKKKTLKMKCDSETNCLKKRGGWKSFRKEKLKAAVFSDEDPATAPLLWKDKLTDRKQSTSGTTNMMTEKSMEDYDDEDHTEKPIEDEEEVSSEVIDDWTSPPPTSSSATVFKSFIRD